MKTSDPGTKPKVTAGLGGVMGAAKPKVVAPPLAAKGAGGGTRTVAPVMPTTPTRPTMALPTAPGGIAAGAIGSEYAARAHAAGYQVPKITLTAYPGKGPWVQYTSTPIGAGYTAPRIGALENNSYAQTMGLAHSIRMEQLERIHNAQYIPEPYNYYTAPRIADFEAANYNDVMGLPPVNDYGGSGGGGSVGSGSYGYGGGGGGYGTYSSPFSLGLVNWRI